MQSNTHLRVTVIAAAMLALGAGAQAARTPELRRLVVVGDSLMAGFTNGGLTIKSQKQSPAGFVARRARVRFPLPLMEPPGVPAPYEIVDDDGDGQLDPGEVRRQGTIGFRDDPDEEPRNLAVPGETITSVLDSIDSAGLARSIVGGSDVAGRDLLKFLILGLPLRDESVSQVSRAVELTPSYLLVWIGSNDVLPMATKTSPDAVTLDAAGFGSRFRQVLRLLAGTGADMAVANLADVTKIASLRRAAGEVTSCRGVDGVERGVAADDLLSIDLDRSTLPTPPCAKVLDGAEQATVRTRIMNFNAEIAAAVAEVSQERGVRIALVDMFALFDSITQNGVDLNGDGTPDLTTKYLGGVFGLDGVHPTRTGNAVIANTFITAINGQLGTSIPPINVARIAAREPLTRSPFRPAGEPPFGLIAGNDDALEDYFSGVGEDIHDHLEDLGKDIRRALVDEI